MEQRERRHKHLSLYLLRLVSSHRLRDISQSTKPLKGMFSHHHPSLRNPCARVTQGLFLDFSAPLLAAQGPQEQGPLTFI
jgi:hypothetical protein